MSYQRDYLLRMIEMIGDLIAGILGLIKRGVFEKATKSIDEVYMTVLKEDARFFRLIPLENLTDELIGKHNYSNDHLEILAELFYAEGELQKVQAKYPEALLNFQKAFVLNEFTSKSEGTFSISMQKRQDYLQQEIKRYK